MDNKPKNLILGVAVDYGFEDLRPFLVSLRNVGYQGDLVLFVSGLGRRTLASLRKLGARTIPVKLQYPYLRDIRAYGTLPVAHAGGMPPNCARYIMYYLYLLEHGGAYDRVLITDVRDVIFQRDPFDFPFQRGLYCFLEDRSQTIASEPHNAGWLVDAGGETTLRELGGNVISCSGVTVGDTASILGYLERMNVMLLRIRPQWGTDQGVHNYLIYTRALPNLMLVKNETGPVLTLGLVTEPRLDAAGRLVNRDGSIPNVVHQYDRHDVLNRRWHSAVYIRWRAWRTCIRGFLARQRLVARLYAYLKYF